MTALSDLKVIDLSTGIAGPFCTMLFAGFGADVLRVEPPSGEQSSRTRPFPDSDLNPAAGRMHVYLNSRKRTVTLDVESDEGVAFVTERCAGADIVVETFSPGHLDELGLGFRTLEQVNPGLVLVSITPFGQTGPWRDYQATDLVEYGAAGLSYVNGDPAREPLKEPGPESYYQAGACAFIGAMSALAHRDLTGEGQAVDISVLEAAASTFAPQFLGAMHSGEPVARGTSPLLPCKDGYVSLNVRHDATWEYMWLFFDEPELAHNPKYATAAARRLYSTEIEEILLPHLARHTMEELFLGLAPLRLLVGMTMTVEGLLGDRHLREREFFEPSTAGGVIPGAPFRMSETPWVSGPYPPLVNGDPPEHGGRACATNLSRGH